MQHERLVARVYSTVDSPFKFQILAGNVGSIRNVGKTVGCGIDPSNTNHQPPVTTLKPIAYSWIPQMGETSPRLGLETNFEDIVPWRLMAALAVEELDHSVDIRISMDMRIHHPWWPRKCEFPYDNSPCWHVWILSWHSRFQSPSLQGFGTLILPFPIFFVIHFSKRSHKKQDPGSWLVDLCDILYHPQVGIK